MPSRRVALLWWLAAIAACCAGALERREDAVLAAIDAETDATREYVRLLGRKKALLVALIEAERQHGAPVAESQSGEGRGRNSSHSTRRHSGHRSSQRHVHEYVDDWLAPHSTWYPVAPRPARNASQLHVELISFKGIGSVNARRNNHPSRSGFVDPSSPLLQFLMVLNKASGDFELFHPTSHELLWQQRLQIAAPVTSVHFHSDRATYLVLTTSEGNLMSYKIRVFHGRRLVGGDYRRSSGVERLWCECVTHLPRHFVETGKIDALRSSPRQRFVDELLDPAYHSVKTQAPVGLHLHLEVELAFVARSAFQLVTTTVVASHSSTVVVASSRDGRVAFYHGHNGIFAKVMPSLVPSIRAMQPLASGVVAIAAGNQVRFVDAFDHRLLDLRCQGSRHTIQTLVRDAWHQSVLYAGTSEGTVLVFKLNRFGSIRRINGLGSIGSDVEDQDDGELSFPSCSLTGMILPEARVLDLATSKSRDRLALIAALPGYLLSVRGNHLVLHATSSSQPGSPSRLAEKVLSLSPSEHIVSVDSTRDLHSSPAAAALTILDTERSQLRVEILTSRIAPATTNFEIGWIRVPMMLLCAVGVMFWQQNRFRRPTTPSDFDIGVGFGRRRGGYHDWSKSGPSANHRPWS